MKCYCGNQIPPAIRGGKQAETCSEECAQVLYRQKNKGKAREIILERRRADSLINRFLYGAA